MTPFGPCYFTKIDYKHLQIGLVYDFFSSNLIKMETGWLKTQFKNNK